MANGSKKSASNGNGAANLKQRLRDASAKFEAAIERESPPAPYSFRLYVTGSTPRSLKAVYNLKRFCEEHLSNDYDLEVIDIYKDPDAARAEQIIAAPTLVKSLPAPLRRFVGDLSNTQNLLRGLDIHE
jgi:circadian clock protein KaiB